MEPAATIALTNHQVKTHEFLNSLSSVRSLAELLVDNPGLDAGDRSRFIAIIRDETERLIHLLAHLTADADTAT